MEDRIDALERRVDFAMEVLQVEQILTRGLLIATIDYISKAQQDGEAPMQYVQKMLAFVDGYELDVCDPQYLEEAKERARMNLDVLARTLRS